MQRLLRGKQDEKTYCLTGECSPDFERCLTARVPVASLISRPSHSSPFVSKSMLTDVGPVELWATSSVVQAKRQIDRALRAAIAETVVPTIAEQAQLPKPGSAVVVLNTIWGAASRRHSFRQRCSVRGCPSGYISGH